MGSTLNNIISGIRKMTPEKADVIYNKLKNHIACYVYGNGSIRKYIHWMAVLRYDLSRPTFEQFLELYNIELIEEN